MRGHSPRKRRARAYSPKPTGRRCAAWCAACALRERSEPTRARRLLAEGGSARSCSCGAGARVRGVLGALQVVIEDCSSVKGMSPDGEGEEQTGAEIRSHTGHTLPRSSSSSLSKGASSAQGGGLAEAHAWRCRPSGAQRAGAGQRHRPAPPHEPSKADAERPSDASEPRCSGRVFFCLSTFDFSRLPRPSALRRLYPRHLAPLARSAVL